MKLILANYSFYNSTDEEIIEYGKKYGGICIAYGSNSYTNTVSKVNEIFSWIREDYPDIKEDDVRICMLTNSFLINNDLMLQFIVSADEFIRLRNAKMITLNM
jgi:hypothetical protein